LRLYHRFIVVIAESLLQIPMLSGADLGDLMIRIGMGKMSFLPTITLIAHPSTKFLLKNIPHPLGLIQAMTQLWQTLKLSLL